MIAVTPQDRPLSSSATYVDTGLSTPIFSMFEIPSINESHVGKSQLRYLKLTGVFIR